MIKEREKGTEIDGCLEVGGLCLDLHARAARLDGRLLDLTTLEFSLLAHLAEHPGWVFSPEQLLREVWGYEYTDDVRVVYTHIRNLRRKLGDTSSSSPLIQTVRGTGYRLVGNANDIAAASRISVENATVFPQSLTTENAAEASSSTRRRIRPKWLLLAAIPIMLAVLGGVAWAIVGGSAGRTGSSSSTTSDTQPGAAVALVASATSISSTGSTVPHHNMWINLKPSGTQPSPRMDQAMVYVPETGQIVMFGGGDINGQAGCRPLNDTWAYDPVANTWTELKPTGALPAARVGHTMVWDLFFSRIIMFGGTTTTTADGALNDTWAYNPVTNEWTELALPEPLPSTRFGHSMSFSFREGYLLLFGGRGRDDLDLNDAWRFDPWNNAWIEIGSPETVPPARYGLSMVWDYMQGVTMFGGMVDNYPSNETWTYRPYLNSWTERTFAGEQPRPRYGQAMVYLRDCSLAIMFGGGREDMFNETWAYDPAINTWTNLDPIAPLPPPRAGHSMAVDESGGLAIVFGGMGRDGLLNDTWAYVP